MRVDSQKIAITERLEEPLRQEKAELVDILVSRFHDRSTIRVFVYSENGPTLGECARLSRIIGDILDSTELIEGEYTLEVSSPGLDRPLTELRDFKYRIGETVKVDFLDDKRERLQAEIVGASEESIELKNGSGIVRVGIDEIKSATIVF